MALDISTLNQWIQYNPKILTKVLYQDTFLNKVPITVYPNSKGGIFRTRVFSPVANLSACCTVPNGQSGFTELDIKATCLLDGSEYCETDLAQLITNIDTRFSVTAGAESVTPIEQVITEGQLAAFTAAIDTLIFQGDTSSTNTNLNKYDGLIKQLSATTSPSVKLSITTGNVFEALQKSVAALPPTARLMGKVGILVGQEVYDAYCMSLLNKNLYHFQPPVSEQNTNNIEIPMLGWSNIVIIPTRGLNGTDKVIVTPLENIIGLTSAREDVNTILWEYNTYHQVYFWRIKAIIGIAIALQDWAVITTLDPSVITNVCSAC